MFKKVFFLFFSFALTGCTDVTVTTMVEAISSLDESSTSKSYFVQAYEEQNTNTLSWEINKKIFIVELQKKNIEVVNSKSNSDYVVFFGYGIDKGEKVTTNYSIPQFGVTGYSGSNTYGTAYGNAYSATTTLTPTYGITGHSSGSTTNLIFTRSLKVDIYNRRTGKQVYEAIAISAGFCHSFSPVASSIIKSVLINFPNGKTGIVNLAPDENFEC